MKNRCMTRFFALISFVAFAPIAAIAANSTPNIIIVYADDQGYQDLGCYGSPNIKTPHIDGLAKEGVRFTSFYSAYGVCSASRASLMTGCYQPRLSMPGVFWPHDRRGVNPNEVTIAELLKTKDYATMCIGKWHLGDSPEVMPTAQGFDHYFGIPYSNDMALDKGWRNIPDHLDKIWAEKKWDLYNNNLHRDAEKVEGPVNQVTLTDRYTEEAVKFIRKNAEKPFFLYMPHTMPHVPLFVSDERYKADPKLAYKLTIEHIDWSVGELLKTLTDLDLENNTIFVYSSDNGPSLSKMHHGGSAFPLRNGKATTWDGGMRVPGIVRWPGHVPSGVVSDEVVSTIDLLPTIAEITGAKLPAHPIDGLSILETLKDPKKASPHRDAGFFYYRKGKIEAVRMGKWKLRLGKLYDLDADIGETKDVAAEHPEKVAMLNKVMQAYDKNLKANTRPLWQILDSKDGK